MLSMLGLLWGKIQYFAIAGVALLAGIASAVLWGYQRGKDKERVKHLEKTQKAKEAHDAKITDAANARNESLARDAHNAHGGVGDSVADSSSPASVPVDRYKDDPYRRD